MSTQIFIQFLLFDDWKFWKEAAGEPAWEASPAGKDGDAAGKDGEAAGKDSDWTGLMFAFAAGKRKYN